MSSPPIDEKRARELTLEAVKKLWLVVDAMPDDTSTVAMIDALGMVLASLLMTLPARNEEMFELSLRRIRGQFEDLMKARAVTAAAAEGRVARGSSTPS